MNEIDIGDGSHAEGYAEGSDVIAAGINSYAIGYNSIVTGINSYAIGIHQKLIKLCHIGCCAHWYSKWKEPRIVWCRVRIEVAEWEALNLLNRDLRELISKKIRDQPKGNNINVTRSDHI